MSQQNVDLIRRAVELGNAGGLEHVAALYHPDVEVRDLQHLPDIPEVLRGRRALVATWERWLETLGGWTAEAIEYLDADPWVVCDMLWHATGKGSEASVDWRVAEAYEVRDGLIVRQISGFPDVAAALAAIAPAR